MKKILQGVFFLSLFLVASTSFSQLVLGDPINSGVLPSDDDAICDIPIYPEILAYTSHYNPGQTVPDFTLFDVDGNEFNLGDMLSDGKPVLMIGASYTCYVFRDKIPIINVLNELYGDMAHIVILYTVEAHPFGDLSPYFGSEYVGDENVEDGVLYSQPTTYGERKNLVEIMLDDIAIDVPVLIDGPCNEVWLDYGTLPNSAYLIDTNGKVFEFQDWLNKYPEDIFDVMTLYFTGEETEGPDPSGYFSLDDYPTDCLTGAPGATIVSHVTLSNPDDVDAWVSITKDNISIPDGWSTSICTDICYPPDVTTATMIVPAGEEKEFTYYFYTDGIEAEGEVDLLLEQVLNEDLTYNLTLKACTVDGAPVGIDEVAETAFEVYPNPAHDRLTVEMQLTDTPARIFITNSLGQIMQSVSMEGVTKMELNISDLPKGIYFVQYEYANSRIFRMVSVN